MSQFASVAPGDICRDFYMKYGHLPVLLLKVNIFLLGLGNVGACYTTLCKNWNSPEDAYITKGFKKYHRTGSRKPEKQKVIRPQPSPSF